MASDKMPWVFVSVFFILTASLSYLFWKSSMARLEKKYNEALETLCLSQLSGFTSIPESRPEKAGINLDETLGPSYRTWKIWRAGYNATPAAGFERKLASVSGVFSVWDRNTFKACGYVGDGSIHSATPERYDCGFPALISESSNAWFNITEYSGNLYAVELSRGPGLSAGILAEGCVASSKS